MPGVPEGRGCHSRRPRIRALRWARGLPDKPYPPGDLPDHFPLLVAAVDLFVALPRVVCGFVERTLLEEFPVLKELLINTANELYCKYDEASP